MLAVAALSKLGGHSDGIRESIYPVQDAVTTPTALYG